MLWFLCYHFVNHIDALGVYIELLMLMILITISWKISIRRINRC